CRRRRRPAPALDGPWRAALPLGRRRDLPSAGGLRWFCSLALPSNGTRHALPPHARRLRPPRRHGHRLRARVSPTDLEARRRRRRPRLLTPAWWGRGFATEAAHALLAYAFDRLDVQEV